MINLLWARTRRLLINDPCRWEHHEYDLLGWQVFAICLVQDHLSSGSQCSLLFSDSAACERSMLLLDDWAGSVRTTLEALFRCFELPEQSTGFFSAILFDQCTNAILPPWPNTGLSMLEKYWISESRLRILRFCEVACWQDWFLWWRKITAPLRTACIDQITLK